MRWLCTSLAYFFKAAWSRLDGLKPPLTLWSFTDTCSPQVLPLADAQAFRSTRAELNWAMELNEQTMDRLRDQLLEMLQDDKVKYSDFTKLLNVYLTHFECRLKIIRDLALELANPHNELPESQPSDEEYPW